MVRFYPAIGPENVLSPGVMTGQKRTIGALRQGSGVGSCVGAGSRAARAATSPRCPLPVVRFYPAIGPGNVLIRGPMTG
ncbi:hypothetical protein GCM10010413_34920 [Promicromonospora sukumoe]